MKFCLSFFNKRLLWSNFCWALVTATLFILLYFGVDYEPNENEEREIEKMLAIVSHLNPNEHIVNGRFDPARKYLMVRCDKESEANADCGGWGDRLKSIFTGYWLALLTNRTFILKMTRPCDLTNIYEPNEVNWNIDIGGHEANMSKKIVKRMNTEEYKEQMRRAKGLDDFVTDEQLIILITNRNLVETISDNTNEFFRAQFKYLGFKDTSYTRIKLQYSFGVIFRKLFKLRPFMADKLAEFRRRAKPDNRTRLVCAHVRIGGHMDERNPTKPEDEYFQSPKHIGYFWDFIEQTFLSVNSRWLDRRTNDYKLFLTTDRDYVHEQALMRFGSERVVVNKGDFFNIDLIRQQPNCSSVEKTYLDFHSYQYCDMSVISNSQFSKYGHLLMSREKRRKPILFMFYPLKLKFYRYYSFKNFESI